MSLKKINGVWTVAYEGDGYRGGGVYEPGPLELGLWLAWKALLCLAKWLTCPVWGPFYLLGLFAKSY